MKKAPKDALAKFALRVQHVKPDAAPDLKRRAWLKLCVHPAVKKAVEAFRTAHPDWEEGIQKIIDTLGRKQQKKSPGVRDKKRNKTKKGKKNMDDHVKEEKDVHEEKSSDEEEDRDDSGDAEKDRAPPHDKPKKESKPTLAKRRGAMEVKVLHLLQEGSDDSLEASDESSGTKDDENELDVDDSSEEKVPQSKDKRLPNVGSFFLGGESESEESEEEVDHNESHSRSDQPSTFFESQRRQKSQGHGQSSRERPRKNFQQRPEKKFTKDKTRVKRHQEAGNYQVESKKQTLHPSWAAKKANKVIEPFQGKKITFDSVGGDVVKSFEKPRISEKTRDTSSSLHPSWAAKKANKAIEPFQGKKTTFD